MNHDCTDTPKSIVCNTLVVKVSLSVLWNFVFALLVVHLDGSRYKLLDNMTSVCIAVNL